MTNEDLKKHLDRLTELDKHMSESNEENFDPSLFNEIDNLLKLLGNEIDSNNEKNKQSLSKLNVNIKKLSPLAVIPTYSKDGDAGMDLTITSIISETTTDVTYGFGVAMEIPRGFVGLVFPRSSVRKYDLSLTNCVGVIDSGYRGELQATFKKTSWLKGGNSEKYEIGDRGAQIIILPYPQVQFNEVDELSSTDRGDGGFGSTGN